MAKHFGKLLKERRIILKMSIPYVAKHVQTSELAIWSMEQSRFRPNRRMTMRLAEIYGLPADMLYNYIRTNKQRGKIIIR